MTEHSALAMVAEPGQPPRLVEPVPPLSLVSLDVLLSARLREWLTISGSDVQLAGHRFVIVGWTQDCLVWRHVAPA